MSYARLLFTAADLVGNQSPQQVALDVAKLVMAGWTGRDSRALESHVHELRKIGVTPPSEMPCFYHVAANQITTNDEIQVLGPDTSGEVEFVLIRSVHGFWVGTGSDETDRKLEAHSIAASKQICAKSIAPLLWKYDEVVEHWDELRLRSWMTANGERRLYQDRPVTDLLHPKDLIDRYSGGQGAIAVGTVLFGGTCEVIGAVAGGTRFDYELEDPVIGRRICFGYDVHVLPIGQQ